MKDQALVKERSPALGPLEQADVSGLLFWSMLVCSLLLHSLFFFYSSRELTQPRMFQVLDVELLPQGTSPNQVLPGQGQGSVQVAHPRPKQVPFLESQKSIPRPQDKPQLPVQPRTRPRRPSHDVASHQETSHRVTSHRVADRRKTGHSVSGQEGVESAKTSAQKACSRGACSKVLGSGERLAKDQRPSNQRIQEMPPKAGQRAANQPPVGQVRSIQEGKPQAGPVVPLVSQRGGGQAKKVGSLLKEYFSQVRREIEAHKHYPWIARRLQRQGKVEVSFVINADGSISQLKLKQAARYGLLNRAAIKAVQDCAPFPRPPGELSKRPLVLEVCISFELH